MVQKERMERGEENVNEMGGAGGEGKPFEIFGKDVNLNSSAILQNGVKAKYRLLHCSCVLTVVPLRNPDQKIPSFSATIRARCMLPLPITVLKFFWEVPYEFGSSNYDVMCIQVILAGMKFILCSLFFIY